MQRPPPWFIVGLIFFAASVLLLSNQGVRTAVNRGLFNEDRKVLSIVTADLLKTRHVFRVLKISDSEGISVEVYAPTEDGGWSLWDRLVLPDRKDGFFHVFGQATNLALRDLDADGRPEIMAPTYDRHMTPHLNAIKLNDDLKKLEAYPGPTP